MAGGLQMVCMFAIDNMMGWRCSSLRPEGVISACAGSAAHIPAAKVQALNMRARRNLAC